MFTTWLPTILLLFAPPLLVLILRWRWRAWRRARISGLLVSLWLVSLLPACSVLAESVALSWLAHEAAVSADVRVRTMTASAHREQVAATARRHQVDPRLVAAIIQVESAGDVTAVSPAGALGIMQIMPDTARELGLHQPFDAGENIEAGTRYLAWLIEYFQGDVETAIMAYHGGPGRLARSGPRPIDHEYLRRVETAYGGSVANAIATIEFGPIYQRATITQGPHGMDYGHYAVDLAAGRGATVYSPIGGYIMHNGAAALGNTELVIENERYIVTLWHGNWTARPGSHVRQGQPVGTESNFGYTRSGGVLCHERPGCGNHTHLNIYDKFVGRNVNPLDFSLTVE